MSCAACSARVEKAVSGVPGVTACSVSLLTHSMGVEGTAEPAQIIAAVEAAGYGAAKRGADKPSMAAKDMEEQLQDRETPRLKRRLAYSVGFLAVLMYVSMGHVMLGWQMPAFFEGNPVALGLLQLLLTGIIMVINQKFFISGFRGLLHRAPNMDTLVALGSGAAFVYSTYALFAMSAAQAEGDMAGAMQYLHELYFESAAMILTLITVGKMLEARSKGRTTDALKSLMRLSPETAVLWVDGQEQVVPIEQVKKGDIFVVRPGENIPVDGIVLEGSSAVNEAALTGESIPVDKAAGDGVSAATLNQSGFLKCEAARVGEDTTLAQIIQMVSDAAATKAPIAKVADQVSGIFVPAVIGIAAVTSILWLLLGESIGFALARGISVLVISCPCALGLATPVAIMVGGGMGAKQGILFKTAASLEETGKAQIIALDKTGTITCGAPQVTDVIPAEGITQEELLRCAYALEQKSEHPLAKAVLQKAEELGLVQEEISEFQVHVGNGLSGRLHGSLLQGGNEAYISRNAELPKQLCDRAGELAAQGRTPLYFAKDGKALGLIAAADVIKQESPQAIAELRAMGLRVVMLTGDNERTARAIGTQAGVDEVIAGVLPEGKENVIRSLKEQGRTIMVGDGINDAPALTRADVGIAIGAGTDVAIDAADVVLMKSRLSDVPAAIRLSRAALRNIHQNLFWAFFYNVIGIPLAAGVWIPLFGWKLNPMFGAAAMSLSSFCVVTNALRLNFFDMYDSRQERRKKNNQQDETAESSKEQNDKAKDGYAQRGKAQAEPQKIAEQKKEEDKMQKTFQVEGMMCPHCEARVKKALEEISGVQEAIPSHQAGTVIVTLTEDIADTVLTQAIEAQGYQVRG